jgi:hypothetical protein
MYRGRLIKHLLEEMELRSKLYFKVSRDALKLSQ